MGAAASNFKWLLFNDLDDLRSEMDAMLQKMNMNLDERRKLNEARVAFSRDLHNIRNSSIHNAEVLETTKQTMAQY